MTTEEDGTILGVAEKEENGVAEEEENGDRGGLWLGILQRMVKGDLQRVEEEGRN